MTNSQNRKDLTEILLVQWSKFNNVHIKIKGSTLFTGVNGSGKSTILDALSYLLTGNTQFNKAAQDRDRTVLSYIRGDTKSTGADRFLRQGAVISYLAAEFFSPGEEEPFVIGVCMESMDETGFRSSWFIKRNARIRDISFYEVSDGRLIVSPKNALRCKAESFKSADFLSRERGIEQVMRILGLSCDVGKYRSKLMKMMAFSPENNIDRFIAQSVLDPKPIRTIEIVREQKQKFDQMKQLYDGLLAKKEKLREMDEAIGDYEEKNDSLRFYQMLHSYQELELSRREAKQIALNRELVDQDIADLNRQLEENRGNLEHAKLRLRQAEENCRENDLDRSLQQLLDQRKELEKRRIEEEQKVLGIQRLQQQLRESGKLFFSHAKLAREQVELLRRLDVPGEKKEDKKKALLLLRRQAEELTEQQLHRRVQAEEARKQTEQQMAGLERQRQLLESHRMAYDPRYEKERELLRRELEKQGISVEIRYLCELVSEITDPSWQKVLEIYLGRKRYHLIVEKEYCHRIMEIIRQQKLRYLSLVLTEKIPETETEENSAAGLLRVPNREARKYLNYILNPIHLCDSLEELSDYPTGGLTRDGMLAKSYTVSRMPMNKISYCLGNQAMELQAEQIRQQLEELRQNKEELCRQEEESGRIYECAAQFRMDMSGYDLESVERLEEYRRQEQELLWEQEKIQKDPGFADLMEKQDQAEEALHRMEDQERAMLKQLGEKENEQKRQMEKQKEIAGRVYLQQQEFEKWEAENKDLIQRVPGEYQKLTEKRADGVAVTASKLRAVEEARQRAVGRLEEVQFSYSVLTGENPNKRGTSYIPYYRSLLNEIGNVRAEETRQRLERQHERLESAFMNEFVAELVENIQNAKREIYEINRELEKLPFGKDIYTFQMLPRADKRGFFQIADKISGFMNNLDAYMAMNRGDEELEHSIHEFMNKILEGENEEEYADYRNYFRYDMEIMNRSGGREIVTELSAKQGSASGGEKQTPYFIILAASLMQCYPSNACCARLAFIDEAFSALSRERIEQMVRYLEQNRFQVMYAAPPEKIGSIGSYIESTVSLIETGRFTNVIEGMKL